MTRIVLVLLALLALPGWILMSSTSPSAAQEQGTITGTVINGTAGGGSTAGLPVTLVISGSSTGGGSSAGGGGTTDQGHQQTVADDAGAFVFDQVPLSSGTTYQLSTVYAGVLYSTPPASLATADGLSDQKLNVYETTSDASVIHASIAHLLIERDQQNKQSLLVTEIVAIDNSGDRAYVGASTGQAGAAPSDPGQRPQTLRFPVPADATEIGIIDGLTVESLVTTDSGFADTSPWVPGEHQVAFTYTLPYQGSSYALDTSLDFPVDTVTILMSKSIGSMESQSPFTQDETDLQGETYLRAQAEKLPAGAPIQAELTGLSSGGGNNAQTAAFAAVVAAAFAAVAVAAFTLYRRSRLGLRAQPIDPNEREKAGLLLAIAELDRQHEAGEIAEPEYVRRRAEARKRLEAIW